MKKNEEIIEINFDNTKSEFEKFITDALKESNINNIYDQLLKAYDELPNYLEQIKNSKKIAFILNSNILYKIDRLSQKNYININILLSKILYLILDASNFKLLSDEAKTLIFLCNICMNLLELISSYELNQNLIKRLITFLNFLKNNSEKYLNWEQINIINNTQKNLGEKIYSNEYLTFGDNFIKDIITFLKKESLNEKEKGIINLNNYFVRLKTLNEQFDLLCVYGYLILNAVMEKANPCYIELYYRAADFITSFVYNFYYIIKLEKNDNLNTNNFYISDNMDINNILNINDIKLENFENINNPENLNFICGKKFELDEQKSLLLNYPNIFSISSTLISYLMIYESSFECQYVSYLIIKKLYFIFPQYRDKLEDLLPIILINLLSFKKTQIKNKDFSSYEIFLKYLLKTGSENLKEKIKMRLNAQNLEKDYLNEKNEIIEINDVEFDDIFLDEFNLRIGCPVNLEISAGYSEEKILEINYPNSIIFIMFNTVGMNITFRLCKFFPLINDENDEKHFHEIFTLEKTEGSKIILFVKNPGIYKVVFDNKYSWINYKTVKYRISVIKEIENQNNINSNIENNIIHNKNENENKNEEEIINII